MNKKMLDRGLFLMSTYKTTFASSQTFRLHRYRCPQAPDSRGAGLLAAAFDRYLVFGILTSLAIIMIKSSRCFHCCNLFGKSVK